jgi:hypothetical protein
MPSFATDSSLDYWVKKGLIVDVLKTLCLNVKRKNKYKHEKKNKLLERLMKPSLNPNIQV